MSNTYPNLNLTEFPDAIDGKYIMADISDGNIARIQQYESYLASGNVTLANEYLANNSDLIPVCFNANKWNRHEHMILALENYYNDEVHDYLLNIVQDKGVYDGSNSYKKYNVVSHTSEGVTQYYMAATNVPVGISPTSPSASNYWIALTVRGERGAPGIDLSYEGIYDPSVTYSVDSCVSYNKGFWQSKQANNLGNTPSASSAYWEQVFEVSTAASAVRFNDNTTLQAWRSTADNAINSNTSDIANLKKSILTVYISNSGSDSNDGLSADYPKLTVTNVLNTYHNIRHIQIRFMDGIYTDHIVLNSLPIITILSNSEDATKVKFTGGVEVYNSIADIKDVTFDSSAYNGNPLILRRSTADVSNCKFVGNSNYSDIKFVTSQADVDSCTFTGGKNAVRAEDAAYVNVKSCQGSGVNLAYYSHSGSTINIHSDNSISADTNVYTGENAGTTKTDSVLPISNGGTGGKTLTQVRQNLMFGYDVILTNIGGNGSEKSISSQVVKEKLKIYCVYSVVVQNTEDNRTVSRVFPGILVGGTDIHFGGFNNGVFVSGVLHITNDSVTNYATRMSVELSAYKKHNLVSDVATSDGYVVSTLNGHV